MLLFATILKYMFFYTCVIMTIKRDMQALMNEGVNACLSNTLESFNLSKITQSTPPNKYMGLVMLWGSYISF